MTAVLTPDQAKEVRATRARADTSYDNGNIHSQVDYLARAPSLQEDEPAWRLACERGLDFMLRVAIFQRRLSPTLSEPQGFSCPYHFQ